MDGIIDSMDMSLCRLREIAKDREAWSAAVYGVTDLDTTKQMNNNKCTKVCLGKVLGFPIVMYGCESWAINKAEC